MKLFPITVFSIGFCFAAENHFNQKLDISPQAGITDAVVDFFDGSPAGMDRYRQVKEKYSDIEIWDHKEDVNSSYNFSYKPEQIKIVYEDLAEADDYEGYYPRHSLTLEYQPPGWNKYLKSFIYKANVFVFKGSGDKELLNRPLVVADAFDPIGQRSILDIQNEPRYASLLKVDDSDEVFTPRELGYDVVFIDFKQGGGRIDFNAKLFAKVLEYIQQKSNPPIVVSGISMSGLVARTALLMGEAKNSWNGQNLFPNVIGWLSIDSPQEGASIGSLQRAIWSMMRNEDIEFGLDLTDANSTLASTFVQLNVPAAHQMLKHHFYAGEDYLSFGFEAFQDALKSMGNFPEIYSEAIAYSSWYLPNQDMPIHENHIAKRIKISDIGYQYSLEAGGQEGGKGLVEYEPGSAGNWYFEVFAGQQAPHMYETNVGNGQENFAGTFIPIRSALALGDINWEETSVRILSDSLSERSLASVSKFDRIHWMNGLNNYSEEFGQDEPKNELMKNRYEHMVFDQQIMNQIAESLHHIEFQDLYTPVLGVY